ncbi:YiiX/YebB-like N1pC/P60 family cysteine hydrolase [Rubellimicrobium sp. CFH 75288]|uniref:YiiX/YebB-like N1pC/P60 family cysteine hydrolase n=1 Tax=Rubellimicrobium sp. CFH 75288 TaxID=2697034 RepID=UPI00141312AF|nr:YiiX/YebB-like N1pC/P60 family cysteine hydrolase [Rubellimicrobium sp. CFH 75288]NAZ37059.1 hypothetical protein [Rubellimicrobium sp. CFH 75288]
MRQVWPMALLCGMLGGCTPFHPPRPGDPVPDDPAAALAGCCEGEDARLGAYLGLFDQTTGGGAGALPPALVRAGRDAALRRGWIEGRQGPQEWVVAQAEPFDVIVVSGKQYLWARVTPGYFTHAAIYLGTEAELRAAGLWAHPALDPWRALLRDRAMVVEASGLAVEVLPLEQVMRVDALALLRPPAVGGRARDERLGRLMGLVGEPFDPRFDGDDRGALYCTELVQAAMPETRLRSREVAGRALLHPDSVVADALTGENGLRFAGFVAGTEEGWFTGTPGLVAATVGRHWPGGLVGGGAGPCARPGR